MKQGTNGYGVGVGFLGWARRADEFEIPTLANVTSPIHLLRCKSYISSIAGKADEHVCRLNAACFPVTGTSVKCTASEDIEAVSETQRQPCGATGFHAACM